MCSLLGRGTCIAYSSRCAAFVGSREGRVAGRQAIAAGMYVGAKM